MAARQPAGPLELAKQLKWISNESAGKCIDLQSIVPDRIPITSTGKVSPSAQSGPQTHQPEPDGIHSPAGPSAMLIRHSSAGIRALEWLAKLKTDMIDRPAEAAPRRPLNEIIIHWLEFAQ